MPGDDPVIAVGLLRRSDLERLGDAFTQWYPIDETPCFGELLRAIDVADRRYRQDSEIAENRSVIGAKVQRRS